MKHSIGRHGLRPNVTPRLLYVHPVQALQQKLNMAVSTMAKVVAALENRAMLGPAAFLSATRRPIRMEGPAQLTLSDSRVRNDSRKTPPTG